MTDEKSKDGVLFELQNVRKIYRMGTEKVVALDDISLTFEKGKIYCLLGTSGSGKSTLLNLLAGLEKPTKGSIKFKGKQIEGKPTEIKRLEKMSEKQLTLYRQKYIGFVFQSYNLLPTLSALENVTLPLIFRKIPKRKRVKAARKILKAVGLGNRWKHRPHELSGGQQQRVSLARAFVNEPQVIFADEPTGNLDTKTTFEMMDLITGMARQREQTLIIVTHDIEISGYADQVIEMRDGLIETITDRPPPSAGGESPGFEDAERKSKNETSENFENISGNADSVDDSGDAVASV